MGEWGRVGSRGGQVGCGRGACTARPKGQGRHEPRLEDVEWLERIREQADQPRFSFDRDVWVDVFIAGWERLTGRRLEELLEMADLGMKCDTVEEYREQDGGGG